MKNLLTYLEQLGLSTLEAKIYLVLLESGAMNAKELADALKINRTATYTYLSPLLEKGIIMSIKHDAKQKFIAAEPKKLKYLIDEKMNNLTRLQEQFPMFVNSLDDTISQIPNKMKVDVKYYNGKNGIKTIYEDMFKANEIRIYSKLSKIVPLFPKGTDLFEKALAKNTALKIFEIYGDSPNDIRKLSYKAESKRYFYKFMPTSVGITSPGIVIYDNKVAIVNTDEKIQGVILYNKDYYLNSKNLFDFVWQMLPNPSL